MILLEMYGAAYRILVRSTLEGDLKGITVRKVPLGANVHL